MEKQEIYKKVKDFYEVFVCSDSIEIDFESKVIPSQPQWAREFHSRNSQEIFVKHFAMKKLQL
jgi:hypothetical protein